MTASQKLIQLKQSRRRCQCCLPDQHSLGGRAAPLLGSGSVEGVTPGAWFSKCVRSFSPLLVTITGTEWPVISWSSQLSLDVFRFLRNSSEAGLLSKVACSAALPFSLGSVAVLLWHANIDFFFFRGFLSWPRFTGSEVILVIVKNFGGKFALSHEQWYIFKIHGNRLHLSLSKVMRTRTKALGITFGSPIAISVMDRGVPVPSWSIYHTMQCPSIGHRLNVKSDQHFYPDLSEWEISEWQNVLDIIQFELGYDKIHELTCAQ